MKRAIIGTLLGLLFCFLAKAQEASVNASLSSAEILIGDEVTLTLQLSYPPNFRLQSIGLGVLEQLDSIEVKNIAPANTASRNPMVNVSQTLTLTSFDEGIYDIPPMPITFSQQGETVSIQTRPLQLKVNTIPISPTDSIGLQPIKDIIREPLKLQDVLPYVGLFVGLMMIGLAIWFFLNRKKFQAAKEIPAPPPPAPHELAEQRIASLRAADYLKKGEFKTYQTQISYILREYLEGRYQVPALEATTFDLLKKLPQIDLPKGWFEPLEQLLQKSDMVKFAKAEFPMDFHQKSLEQLATFVKVSTPIPEPDEVPEEE
jgi:hypothetical protein